MSIIKVNQDGKNHLKIVRLSEFKVKNQTYTINVQGIRVNGATHWVTPLHSSGAMRVIIMANVSASTTGYMFGDSRFAILFAGGNVVWNYNGGQYTRAIEVGTHLFGFIDGKPYYDGSMLSSSTVTASTSADVCYIGSANNPDPTPLNNASIIKVELYGHETNTADVKGTWSYYATRINGNGYLIEKWANILNAHLGTQPTAATQDDGSFDSTVWGVSIDDLRQVVPTGLYDLAGIYTEDGGVVSGDYVEPEIVEGTINGTEVERRMAFRWRTDSGYTLPTGFAKKTHSLDDVEGNVTGIHGELLLGRKPTWNIWADNVNMGRYIHGYDHTQQSISYNTTLRFNLLKDKYGQDKPKGFNLEEWENYSPTLFHKPDLRVNNLQGQKIADFTIEFVNGYLASTNDKYLFTPKNKNYIPVLTYQPVAEVDGNLSFVIGNMVSWHEEHSYYSDNQGVMTHIPIYGGYFAVRLGDGSDDNRQLPVTTTDGGTTYIDGMVTIIGYKLEDIELGSQCSAGLIKTYRETGISVDKAYVNKLPAQQRRFIRQYASGHNGVIPSYVDFGLIAAKKDLVNGAPDLSTLISGRKLVGNKQVTTTVKETSGYKVLLANTQLGDYRINVITAGTNPNVMPIHNDTVTNPNEDAFVLGVVVTDAEGNIVRKVVKARLTLYNENVETCQLIVHSATRQTIQLDADKGIVHDAWFAGSVDFNYYRDNQSLGNVPTNVIGYNTTSGTIDADDGYPIVLAATTNTDPINNQNFISNGKFIDNITFIVEFLSVSDSIQEDNTALITFRIDSKEYYAVEGMTWSDWVNSDYNTFGATLDGIYVVQGDNDILLNGASVEDTDTIISNGDYVCKSL